jgi:ornithine carbamoyltransferase
MGMEIRVASPRGYSVKPEILMLAQSICTWSGGVVFETTDPLEAVREVDVVYTDTWISMGDEGDKINRSHVFKPYQVNNWIMEQADTHAIFMHDLPAYRGNEVTSEVIDGPKSVVFPQAENRLHVEKALILWLMNISIGNS